MPPKKTKPNEKCLCGSGKKHKKCCMVAGKLASSVAASIVLNEVMEALTLATTAYNTATAAAYSDSIGPCCHGSTSDHHFPDGRAYSDVVKRMLALFKDKEGYDELIKDHKEDVRGDSNFSQYIFALCTSWYLRTNATNGDMKFLLYTASVSKYHCDPDQDKLKRYVRTITQRDDRGVINCLSRETKSFCDCMQAKKTEAKGMDKKDMCANCLHSFPRTGMLKCGGCKVVMFCNEDCQTQYWPKHRGFCQGFQKPAAVVRETVPSGKNDQNN